MKWKASAPDGRKRRGIEAFSDGVIAIIITIMVLELKVPHGDRLAALAPLLPVFLSYVLSFVYRRHLLEQPPSHAARRAAGDGRDPVGESASAVLAVAACRSRPAGWARTTSRAVPTALYGVVLLHGGDRLLDPAAAHHRARRARTRCCARRSAATGRASSRRCSTLVAIPPAFVDPVDRRWRCMWPSR